MLKPERPGYLPRWSGLGRLGQVRLWVLEEPHNSGTLSFGADRSGPGHSSQVAFPQMKITVQLSGESAWGKLLPLMPEVRKGNGGCQI